MSRNKGKNSSCMIRNCKYTSLEILDKKLRWCIYLFGANSGLTAYDFSEADVLTIYHTVLRMNSTCYEFETDGFSIPLNSYSLDEIIFRMNTCKSLSVSNNQYDTLVNLIVLAVSKIIESYKSEGGSNYLYSNISCYSIAIYEAIISLKYVSHLISVSIALSQLFRSFWTNFLEQFKGNRMSVLEGNVLLSKFFYLFIITPQLSPNYYSELINIYSNLESIKPSELLPFNLVKQMSDIVAGKCINVSIWRLLILLLFSSDDMCSLILNLLESLEFKKKYIKKELECVDKFIFYLSERKESLSGDKIISYFPNINFDSTKYITISIECLFERFTKASKILNRKYSFNHVDNIPHNFKILRINKSNNIVLYYKSILFEISKLLTNFDNKLPPVAIYNSYFKRYFKFFYNNLSKKLYYKLLQNQVKLAKKFYDLIYKYSSTGCKVVLKDDFDKLNNLIRLKSFECTETAAHTFTLSVFNKECINILERTLMVLYIKTCKPHLISFLQSQLKSCIPYDIGGRVDGLLSSINDDEISSKIQFSEKLVKLSGDLKIIDVNKRLDYLKESLRTFFIDNPSVASIDSVTILPSAERTPFLLKYMINGKEMSYIYKYDDNLSHDLLVMQFIEACRDIFKLRGLQLYLKPYFAHPIICSDGVKGGIIGAIDDVKSRQWIIDSKLSLEDYYKQTFTGNGKPSYEDAISNFINSLAAYSLICYLFDVKDRNNGNLLITDMGHIIHIDFGFILGRFPGLDLKFELAPFKLDRDMIHLLGDRLDSIELKKFTELLIQGYLALREHHKYLIELLTLHKDSGFEYLNEKSIEKFKKRLGVGLTEDQASDVMKKCLIQAYGSKTTIMYDWMQSLQFKTMKFKNIKIKK